MNDGLRQFVFKGLLARHAVTDLQTEGLLHKPAPGVVTRDDIDLFASVQQSIRNGSIQMQRVYRILYVLENMVRDLIASRFSESDGLAWFDAKASSAMKTRVAQRKEQEDRNQWHSGRNKDEIFYLDFGDLAKLITTHWNLFQDLLPSQAWVQARLDEAERSRNVIAHTNLLSAEEVARMELYLRDWMKQIG
jgi:hypothetical protein